MGEPQWKVTGDWVEACNCQLACPCAFNPRTRPTEGECIAMFGWHVNEGWVGNTKLDGLSAVMFLHAPGTMMNGNWRVALYVDEKGTADQREALRRIFSGELGGPLGALVPLIKEVIGVRATPITYKADGKKRSMHLTGMDVEITAVTGQDGNEVPLPNLPFSAVPGSAEIACESDQFRYRDHGYTVDITQKNGFFAPFTYHA